MTRRAASRRTVIDKKRAASILYPIAAFLRAGGLSKEESLRSFAAVLDRASEAKIPRAMEHIGNPTGFADVVGLWTRGKEFLDSHGRSRVLRFLGSSGFSSLVKKAAPDLEARATLKVLMAFGNVRRIGVDQYRLARPFFFTSSEEKMAFEPVAFFLSDASSTLSRILRRRRGSHAPLLFWRKVESDCISDVDAEKFIAFADDRSLMFLEEMDDWLQAHRTTARKSKRTKRRIGLGMFSIYSDLDSSRSKLSGPSAAPLKNGVSIDKNARNRRSDTG